MNERDCNIIIKLNTILDKLLSSKNKFDYEPIDFANIEDDGIKSLAEKIIILFEQYRDCHKFMVDLSRGKLYTESPRMNVFANPFKELHAELRHLTWQIQEISNGDYNQHVSFSGDFSDAINRMIVALREREELTRQIKEYSEELDKMNRTKDRLFSIIAHDLKNSFHPLLAVSNLLEQEVSEKDYDTDRIIEFSKIIHDSATNAFDLLVNLLEWSRLQSNHITVKPELINLNTIIVNNTNIGNTLSTNKNITLEYIIPNNDCMLVSDQAMINTVLRNLIGNAIKYTPQDGYIIVYLEQKDDEYLISVQDNGIGIPKEVTSNLFHTNIVQSTTGTANEKGTGLGLVLCKDFVNKLGGDIWVESEYGYGSKFTFTLKNLTS